MKFSDPLLVKISEHSADDNALSDGLNLTLSFSDLLVGVEQLSTLLSNYPIYGIGLVMDNGPAQIIADLAARESGIWTLQIPPFFTATQSEHAMERSGCRYILSDQADLSSHRLERVDVAGQAIFLYRNQVTVSDQTHANTVKVTFTSGSTGNPKGLCLSHHHTLAPAVSIARNIAPIGIKRHLSLLPLAVLLEQIAGVYAALYSGTECVIPSLDRTGISAKPHINFDLLCSTLRKVQANSCILVPEILQGMVDCFKRSSLTLPDLKYAAVGGSRVSPDLLEAAAALHLPVYEGYGLSEAGSVVTLNTPQKNSYGSTGHVLDHQSIVFSEEREILLTKPSFLGYCGDSIAPPQPFPTGDIGFLDKNGFVFIDGRKKNQLITSMGRNVSPEWLESALLGTGIIQQAYVYGDGSRLLSALVVSKRGKNEISQRIRQVNKLLPDYAHIGTWSRVLPFSYTNGQLTDNGKLCRGAIAKRYTPDTVTCTAL